MKTETIVYLHPHFTIPGGAGKFALETAVRLQQRGHRIVIVCGKVNNDYRRQYPTLDFISISAPLTSSFLFWLLYPKWQKRINAVLNRFNKIILFPQVFPANWWAFVYRRSHPTIPCVWFCQEPSAFIHADNWINAISNPLKRLIARLFRGLFRTIDFNLSHQADRILANSKFSSNSIEDIYARSVDRVIYPGIDDIKFKPVPEQEKQDYLFTVSRLTKFKNIDQIIRAFQKIAEHSNMILKIAGEGEELLNLQKLSRQLNLNHRVEFLHLVSDDALVGLYAKAKIVVFASNNEPFGIVPIEAMACGTPVVASRTGGPKETMRENFTGVLFEPNNIQDMVIKIKFLLAEHRYIKFGRNAAVYARKSFSWENAVEALENVFYPYINE